MAEARKDEMDCNEYDVCGIVKKLLMALAPKVKACILLMQLIP